MAYYPVRSLAEWMDSLSIVSRRTGSMLALLRQVAALEKTAGGEGAIDWPIDEVAAELMWDRVSKDGPFEEYDNEIDAALAPSFRYQYTVEPGRPSTFLCSRLFKNSTTTVHLRANVGTPFSAVILDDLVQILWTTDEGETPVYNNIEVPIVHDSGKGIILYLEHANNQYFIGNADYWSLGVGWRYNANTIDTNGAPLNTDVKQTHMSLQYPFVNGVLYRVQFTVPAWAAGNITPKIGTVAGAAVGAAQTSVQYLTCDANDVDFILDAAGFNGTIDRVFISPVVGEHVSNGVFTEDPATWGHWTYAGNWQYDAVNDWMEDVGVAIAVGTKLQQLTADMTHPIATDIVYRLDFDAATSAGKIRPILGDAIGYYVDDVAVTHYTQYLRSSAGLDLEFESDGNWQGHIVDVHLYEEVENPNGPVIVTLQQTDE